MAFKLTSLLAAILVSFCSYSQTTIFPYSSEWKYQDEGTNPTSNWKDASFDDASWSSGLSVFGYGYPVVTCITAGPNCGANKCAPSPGSCGKYITYYFRKKFNIANLNNHPTFTMNMVRDDGAIVYVNGVEAWRSNMPAGPITPSTLASASAAETIVYTTTIPSTFFVEGENTIAVEVHQNAPNSTDLLFNLELVANNARISRGPYLQMANEDAVTIRWRTNDSSDSRLEVGTSFGSYPLSFSNAAITSEHELRVTGLAADTRYYYRIGNSGEIFKEEESMNFRTAPPANTTRKIGVAVFGDCGRDDNNFRSGSIRSYKNHTGNNPADILLLLGDNAYNNGSEEEYTINFFNPLGPEFLKNHVVFPTPGNHDYGSSTRTARDGPYYKNFTMPSNGECGGVASGTEAYYSFNWGDIHLISLDSYGHEAGTLRMFDTLSPQITWLKADLEANTRKWVVVYFHHPPYTMGSHNSDVEMELVNIRQRFVRILERYGVDLVLAGHSHNYERSLLIKEHYGNEATFSESVHAVSNSSGKYDHSPNSCPYQTYSSQGNHGVVYVVSGSSGADGGIQSGYPHNAMPYPIDDGGMLYLEVEGNRLDAKFLRRDNTVGDQFTILQNVDTAEVVTTTVGQPITLTASWVGNYAWSNNAVTRSITLTPQSAGEQVIVVSDDAVEPCLSKEITLVVATALPVRLKNFEVTRRDGKVFLRWATIEEVNNRNFIIERSGDNRNYSKIAEVLPVQKREGKHSYEFSDQFPLDNISYYRLSQVDLDNKLSVLGTKMIGAVRGRGLELVVENPSRTTVIINIKLRNDLPTTAQVKISDSDGRVVAEKMIDISEVSNQVQFKVDAAGIYIISVVNTDGIRLTRKVVVR